MRTYSTALFKYTDPFSEKNIEKLPETLKFDNISHECLLFRLLTGTVDITDYNGKTIKQRKNYGVLPLKKTNLQNTSDIYENVALTRDVHEQFNKYMRNNRKNTSTYEKVLFEFSNYFYYYEKGNYISCFFHLYRVLEYISFCFPLIYVSATKDYKASYDALKSFLGGEQKSEIKFFQIFQKTLFSDTMLLEMRTNFYIDAPTIDMANEVNDIFSFVMAGNSNDFEKIDEFQYAITNRSLLVFLINLRNRYFHMLTGSGQKNIESTSVDANIVFQSVVENFANWLSYIYFHIVSNGLSQL